MTELEFIKMVIESLEKIEKRMNDEVGYVVCNEDYVNVGKDYGLNGTEVTFNDIISAKYAIIYNSEEEAYKLGQDFNLKNGKGTVELQIVDSKKYFESVIIKAYELIEIEIKNLKNKK